MHFKVQRASLIVDILKTHQNPVIKFVRHVASAGTAFYIKRGEELDQAVVLGKNKTKMTITFKDNHINPFKTFKAGDLYPLHDNEYFTIHENKQNIKDGDPDETSLNIEENESYFIEIAEVTDHRIAFRAHYLNCRLSKLEISDETDIDDNNGPYKEYITKKEGDNTTFHLPCVLDRYKCYLKITINSLEFETRCAHGLINFSVVDAESLWIYSTEGKKILNIRDLLNITYDEEETDEDGGYDAALTIKLK